MPDPDVTTLLHAWRNGDPKAKDELIALVYADLRRRAAAYMRRERRDHTLQPTALVHEAYVRLVRQDRADWQNRAQFFAVASEMMRRVLVDHARGRNMAKRPGRWERVSLDEHPRARARQDADVLDLDAALTRLAAFDPRKSRIAEMRFFAGLSLTDIGRTLNLSVATVEREWRTTRAWLQTELS